MKTKSAPINICFRNRPIVPSMKYMAEIANYFDTLHSGSALQYRCPYRPITFESLRKPHRGRYHTMARTFIAHYLHSYCDWTVQGIGWLFNRDHSTVVHGRRIFEDNISATWDNDFKDHYAILEYGMKRPVFPNYDIHSFYAKYRVVKMVSKKSFVAGSALPQADDISCICHNEIKTGTVAIHCCNLCGKPDEDWWGKHCV